MRSTVRRYCTAGMIAAVLLTGPTACTGHSDERSADKAAACTDGTYAWSGVRRTQKLTAMSAPIMFEKRTASYSAKLEPVGARVFRPSVTGAPRGVGEAGVITALGTHLDVEEPLAGPSEKEVPEKDHYFEVATGDLKGAYYAWGYVRLVEADFTHTCGSGEGAKGRVQTWEGTGSGFLPCSERSDDIAGRIAAQRTCPAGSRAAEDA
ncbi:hypothetical protein ACIP17_16445 [Streptomyces iakyrus]|uniref:hypothetical protein n=1 Tax=Streptomyces iakyrus TaxID=68219 RepID=UPI0036B9E7A4